MEIMRNEAVIKNFRISNEPNAINWESSLLWHGSEISRPKGIQGPFTCLNRAGKNAFYVPITVDTGTIEFYVLDGEFICNKKKYSKGDLLCFGRGNVLNWSSELGGEMLIVLRGELTWHNDKKFIKEEGHCARIFRSKEIEAQYKNYEDVINWMLFSTKTELECSRCDSGYLALNIVQNGCHGSATTKRVPDGCRFEFYVLAGEFYCNEERFSKGDFVTFKVGETFNWSTDQGGTLLEIATQPSRICHIACGSS